MTRTRVLWVAAGVTVVALVAAAVAGATMLVSGPTGPAAMSPPRFVEEGVAAGIEHAYTGGPRFFVGGGVAVFDCDGDRWPDLYLAGGSSTAALFRNETSSGGALRFSRLADATTDLESVTGAYPLDVDGDGLVDLAVLRVGGNQLLRGLGDCRFEPANEEWGIDGGDQWTAAFSATWEGSAALPTLAFGNYQRIDATGEPDGTCADSLLVRPDPSGSRYEQPIALTPGWCTLSVLFSDWDRSGRRDLRMSNDRHYYRDGEEQLWRVAESEPPRLYTRDEGWQRMVIWGMGIASQDLTGDGLPEVYLTSQADNKLQTLTDGPSQPTYGDIALERGATATRPYAGDDQSLPSTAWHAEFQDANNDGYQDLFVSKGNVEAMPDYASRDPSNLLLGQPDGTFRESAEAAGTVDYGRARGAALADLDLDGMLDLVVVMREENVRLWRNVGWGDATDPAAMGGWAAVRLEQPGPNRDGIGSWVQLRLGDRIVEREVTIGGGHAGGQLGWIHLGLGSAARADIRIQWPDGELGPWQSIDANRFGVIERGASSITPWQPQ